MKRSKFTEGFDTAEGEPVDRPCGVVVVFAR